jgi:hypothetical protein
MDMSNSKRRLIENELVFRESNESIKAGIDQLHEMAKEEGYHPIELDGDSQLNFYCECSDENCTQRIKLTPNEYEKLHKQRDIFTVVCGHELEDVEEVVEKRENYCVVRKFKHPPLSPKGLNVTDVQNA